MLERHHDTNTMRFDKLYSLFVGIIKVPPENQNLFTKDQEEMENSKTLSDYGYTTAVARAQSPGFIGLALR